MSVAHMDWCHASVTACDLEPPLRCHVCPGSDKYFDDKEGGGPAGAEGEMYPYVSFSISIDS